MDPISAGLNVVGLGMQLYGMFGGASASSKASDISHAIAEDEKQINAQKYQQMINDSQRRQLEIFRNAQRQRSMATAAAVNQGASSGSGLQGGLAGVSNMSYFNSLGVSQNLEIGQNIFGLNNDISDKKAQMADVQGEQAMYQGIASLGGSMMKSSGTFGALGKNAFGSLKTGFAGPYI